MHSSFESAIAGSGYPLAGSSKFSFDGVRVTFLTPDLQSPRLEALLLKVDAEAQSGANGLAPDVRKWLKIVEAERTQVMIALLRCCCRQHHS